MAVDVSVHSRVPTRPRELATLPHVLEWRAVNQPNDPAFTFLVDGEEPITLTYAELDREARSIAGELRRLAGQGARALLVYDSGLDYIAALYGCLYAGVVAAPVYPPDPFRIDRTLPRLQAIIADAQASLLLATSSTLEWAAPLFKKAPGLKSLVATDAIAAAKPAWRGKPAAERNEVGLLQYTSGSTGTPRGVVISHANLLANLTRIEHAIDREGAVAVSWLPAYHDMGLIGCVFQPVYSGRHTVLMSPLAFIQRPVRWLRAIANYRGTTTAAPNFAYDLCVRKIHSEERKTLDLSSWRLALNGSERVREETMERFAETFAECGFRREAFYPCYGLAEATLMVAGGEVAAPPIVRSYSAAALERDVVAPAVAGERVSRLVGCGKSVYGQHVVIADPVTRARLPERRVGEIWVSGPSIGQGYWNRPDETEHAFRARLASGEGPFLRTGDLGFFDDGELFVAGRVKEMIVICGRNLYPQDIELTVAHCHEALKSDGGAAFSIDVDGEERLVVVQEVVRPKRVDAASLLETIRQRVAEEHGVPVYAVALIVAGELPKTSSGKTRRQACRERYLAGRLNTVLAWQSGAPAGETARREAAVAPRNATETRLAGLWAEVLGLESPGVHDDFFEHGGQSLLATQLLARIRAAFGIELPLRALFESPTIAQLAERIAAAETRRETAPVLRRTARRGAAELSFAQQRLWVLEQLESSPRYNVPASASLRGALDLEMLQKSLNLIVARHETLRTNFQALDGRPLQTVQADRRIPLKFVDLRAEGAAANGRGTREALLERARREAAADAERPFDLEREPLVRAALYRIADDEHLLTLAAHHIVVDGWSMGVFLKELAALYQDTAAGRAPSLAELPVQYSDFAAWQREWLESPAMDRQLRYWTQQFKQPPPALELLTDKPRRGESPFRGGSEFIRLSAELTSALEQLSRREGATLYMTLLAAFEALLARWSGQSEFCIGSPAANRTQVELEPLIGFFVNTLPLRADLSDQPTFRQLLARTRETTLGALANQDLPLDKLVEALRPQRGPKGAALFQTMFVFENFDWSQVNAGGLSIGDVHIEHGALSSFDLTLVVEPQGGELAATLVYNANLFEPQTIRQMLASLETLLASAASDPEASVAGLPLLSAEEARRSSGGLQGAAASFPSDRGIHELFAEQAARAPDALAAVCGEVPWTYGELERRCNQLARYLKSAGVGREVPVGICLPRSLDMLAAVLAVLKSGGAYVPLDPGEAPERLARIIDDLRLPVIIAAHASLPQLPPHEAEEILLDVEWPAILRESDQPLASPVAADQLAYIIYTSGSTGRPKGVEVAHRGLVNHAVELARRYRCDARDRMLQIISLGFDAAAEEIFPALISGAALALPEAHVDLSGRQILDDCRRHEITLLHLPTVLWQQVVAELSPHDAETVGRLKATLVGGETPAAETLARWQAFCQGRVRFLHAYGLTEATITSTLFEIAPGEKLEPMPERLPIGRPIANTQAYVLDEQKRLVPCGAAGELYLGGVGLARGYRNLQEHNGERFVSHPFDSTPGARLLKTGDRARLRPDGTLEFLGRIDRQIKLRGFRIEPGEIERALLEHPAIREAVVICRDDSRGAKRLTAYVVPAGAPAAGGEALTTTELRRWLRSRLPEYMLPSAVVALDSLPLTSHHKIDFEALPAPEISRAHRDEESGAPRTPIEETLAAIWAKALGAERVGIHDNFFELGGDSILSIQVVARAREAGLRFTPKQLFERQTIAELAAVEGTCETIDAEQGPVVGAAPLTPIQRRFLDAQPVDPHHFNQAVLLEVDAGVSPEMLAEALSRLSLHHDALRLRFERGADGWRQWHAGEPSWPLAQFDLSQLAAEEQAAALCQAGDRLQSEFDLGAGPIARAGWFDLGAGRPKRLLLAIHHLAVDAVSWRILLEDLATICRQLRDGQSPSLLPKTTSFRSWARRLDELARDDQIRQEAPFWLADSRRLVRRLPADNPAGENLVAAASEISTQLDETATAALLERAHAAYRTEMNDVLLAALAQALADWTHDWRWLVDLEGHGRLPLFDDVDLSRTVGWFTHCFPVLLELPESRGPGDVLRRVKDELRRTPRWGLSYGLLRYLRQDEISAELAAAPAAEISFNYLGRFDALFPPGGPFVAAAEGCGTTQSRRNQRRHSLEVNASIRGGRLHVAWTYCERTHRRETVERLAAAYLERLRELIAHCTSDEAGGDAASDFPLAGINDQGMEQLARLLDELDRSE